MTALLVVASFPHPGTPRARHSHSTRTHPMMGSAERAPDKLIGASVDHAGDARETAYQRILFAPVHHTRRRGWTFDVDQQTHLHPDFEMVQLNHGAFRKI
ncbi:MAG: hypothetical protein AAGB11_07135 [Pseudomonadota bacterium]